MDKKEKTSEQKAVIKMGQMNRNMFKFITSIPGVDVSMPA